jgi:C4-dicarboxylate-specific signal transduction histidine kinase
MPNGFKLIESTGTEERENSFELTKHIQFLDKELISIRVVKSFTYEGTMQKLQKQLIIGSIFMTFSFGLILWLTVRKYALMPLERSKSHLETVVRERSKTWEEANISLISEIDMRKKTETQLKAKIKELEDIHDTILGREMKMKTLKDEIAKLKKELKSRGTASN